MADIARAETSVKAAYFIAKGLINFEDGGSNYRLALLNPSFDFDKIIHNQYADILAYELEEANGYGRAGGGIPTALDGGWYGTDLSIGSGYKAWPVENITAIGGTIGPFKTIAFLYWPASQVVLGCYTLENTVWLDAGETLTMTNHKIQTLIV